jgi:hypothetical protein
MTKDEAISEVITAALGLEWAHRRYCEHWSTDAPDILPLAADRSLRLLHLLKVIEKCREVLD